MKKYIKYLLLVLPIVVIVLMAFPDSMTRVTEGGAKIQCPHSYFEIMVFGQGAIFALPSAIITILLIVLLFFHIFKKNEALYNIEIGMCVLTILFSLVNQIICGTTYGLIIIALYVVETILIILDKVKISQMD